MKKFARSVLYAFIGLVLAFPSLCMAQATRTSAPPVAPFYWSGSLFQLSRSSSADNLTTGNIVPGVGLVEKAGRWSQVSNPAAGSQATTSKAAGGGTLRHVADCIAFSAAATTAPVLTALTVNLRNGPSGGGSVLWTFQVVIPAATGQSVAPFAVCGLNVITGANVALTLEFSAGLANLIESVSLSGYTVQ